MDGGESCFGGGSGEVLGDPTRDVVGIGEPSDSVDCRSQKSTAINIST